MRLVTVAAVSALLMIAWGAVVGYGVLAGWWHRGLAPAGDTPAFMVAARQRVSSEPHGDLAIALMAKGELADEHYIGLSDAVNRDTVFPVASMSKWVTAVGVMQLAHEGRIDLDAPVARYLTRWTLPASQFDLSGVTARRLLSHTAGLTDGLGFAETGSTSACPRSKSPAERHDPQRARLPRLPSALNRAPAGNTPAAAISSCSSWSRK